jgi:16S rRNA (uracil1498-N3)-methyltransferase
MPQNRFYTKSPLADGNLITIDSDQCHYFRKVLRGEAGETIEIIDGKGSLANALVEAVHKDHFIAKVLSSHHTPERARRLTLAIGFLKPSHFEYAIEKACEIGVDRFFLFEGTLSEKKAVSPVYLERLYAIVESATKQCGRMYLPEIYVKNSLSDCVEKEAACYFGHFGPQTKSIQSITLPNVKDIIVCIGPESGFSKKEADLLMSKKCIPVTLHENTLRAETAVVAAALLFNYKITT